jgi:hypothetical protein
MVATRHSGWILALLVSSAMIGGCAAPTGASVGSSRGAYPGCTADMYGPNANCYGGPP